MTRLGSNQRWPASAAAQSGWYLLTDVVASNSQLLLFTSANAKSRPRPRLIAWSIQTIANGSSSLAFFRGPASTGQSPGFGSSPLPRVSCLHYPLLQAVFLGAGRLQYLAYYVSSSEFRAFVRHCRNDDNLLARRMVERGVRFVLIHTRWLSLILRWFIIFRSCVRCATIVNGACKILPVRPTTWFQGIAKIGGIIVRTL